MDLNRFKDKKCFIYPYSGTSKVLENYLVKNDLNILGFIDGYKSGNNINNLVKAKQVSFDYIFILSPNHAKSIYDELIKTVDKKKLILVLPNKFADFYDFIFDIDGYFKSLFLNHNQLENHFSEKYKSYKLENKVLFIGIGFIDLNLKYLYLYLKKSTNIDVYLATDNSRDIDIFKSFGINIVDINSIEFINLVFKSKIKVIDHTPIDKFLIKCLNIGKTVQLWHGSPVKMVGTQADYKVLNYELICSASPFVTQYLYSKLYNYNDIVHYGYPRNDVLIFDDIEVMNVNKSLLEKMKNDNNKYVIYMPTYRPLGFKSNPIDYIELEKFGAKNDIVFIIKMHPFSAEKVRDDLNDYQPLKNYKNIIIYEANKDIYPLFKYSDLMISDYSSAYFDYMYVDKPILFFCYDYDEYIESADGTILNYFEYSPGDKCYTFEELLEKTILNLNDDKYNLKREEIFNKMFSNQTLKSSELIANKFIDMMR